MIAIGNQTVNSMQFEPDPGVSPVLHLVRHGRIPDHRADHPLTDVGQQEALAAGQQLAAQVRPGETICFFASPTRRTRQTAELLGQGLIEGLAQRELASAVEPLVVDDRLQNLQFYLDGLAYEPLNPLLDAARWRLQETSSLPYQASVTFQTEFWSNPDPMGYWLTHPTDAAEAPAAVAQRCLSYIIERLVNGTGANRLRRDVCVAHSANLRAFLWLVFGRDLGEPPYCGMATVAAGRVYYQDYVENLPGC
jgi:broad specificity phosphatase PhoE